MQINPYIFRNYDIRGKVPADLDAVKVECLGKAYGTFLQRRSIPMAVVGYDCRLSGPEFGAAYIKGLVSTGIDVIDIGMVMTQMMYFAQYHFNTKGGTMITASHNPAIFNGFKIATGFSETTVAHEVQEIRQLTEEENFFVPEKIGEVTKADIKEAYIKDILSRAQVSRKFKVVLNFRHGTPGIYIPDILRRAGCEVIEKLSDIDGSFPAGTPDPTDEEFLKILGQEVLAEKADLGLAFDGDGDRVGVVDENGKILWNDILVAIFAQQILEKTPGAKIIINTLSSQTVVRVIERAGGIPVIWLVGHAFIKAKMAEENAAFGGELSGHFFFKDGFYGHDDGAYAAMRLLQYLSEKNKSLTEIIASFPQYISSPEIKIGCSDEKKKTVIKELGIKFKADFPEGDIIDENTIPGNDGVRLDLPDGMIVFRYSQNGPYITIRFEAQDEKVYNERKKYVREMLESYPDIAWGDDAGVNLDALK